MFRMVDFYNEQRVLFKKSKVDDPKKFVLYDKSKISWTDLFLRDLKNNIEYFFDNQKVVNCTYRPFNRMLVCYENLKPRMKYLEISFYVVVRII